MDRSALAARNRELASALRQPTAKQRLRDSLLKTMARLPLPSSGAGEERLLIIRPDHLGDVLLSTPAIQAIKARSPATSIHVLCGTWAAEALANYDEIERVLTLDFPGFRRTATGRGAWRLALDTARQLRQIGYSSAIVMRHDHWWGALAAFLAGIQTRIGYDLAPGAVFLTHAYPYEQRHAVERNMRLAKGWTGPVEAQDIKLRFPVRAVDREAVQAKLREWKLPQSSARIFIHPGSGMASKLWRAEAWAEAADALAARHDASIIFSGTASENALIDDIRERMKTKTGIAAGATTLGQLAALYEGALAVLGPDSGALHLAAAVGAPTVALFGPADPLEFAPWGDARRQAVVASSIACRPCRILDWRGDDPGFHPCVSDISVEQVLQAADQALAAID